MNVYVHWNGGAWRVMEAEFFRVMVAAHKREKRDGEWWLHWRPLYGVDGIEHGKDKARLTWGVGGERWVDPVNQSIRARREASDSAAEGKVSHAKLPEPKHPPTHWLREWEDKQDTDELEHP